VAVIRWTAVTARHFEVLANLPDKRAPASVHQRLAAMKLIHKR